MIKHIYSAIAAISAINTLVFKSMGIILFAVIAILVTMSDTQLGSDKSKDHVAYVEIYGPIMAGEAASASTILPAVTQAFESKTSKAVVLLINSPGGSPVQAGLMFHEINKLKEKHGKPLYAVIEDLGASAAYYIASAADKIIVDQASMVGSIGVISSGFGFTGLMEKLGVERRMVTAGKNKGFGDAYLPTTPAINQHWKDLLAEIHVQFKEAVIAGRGDRLNTEYPDVFSGLMWSGSKSIEIGLADSQGSLLSVSRDTLEGGVNNVNYTVAPNFLKILSNNTQASIQNLIFSQEQPRIY